MTSDKSSASRLAYIAKEKGIRHVVISPGSRNAPLIIAFGEDDHFTCYNVPDERAAGFFALGTAMKLQEPVILCCTSGSAVVNYGPAVAEAYYQKIPLIVLSADRPPEWIDQNAGQTLRQEKVFHNFIRASYNLVSEPASKDQIWYNDRMINEAIDISITRPLGPVHINIPFEEPLYQQVGFLPDDRLPRIIRTLQPTNQLVEADLDHVRSIWNQAKKVIILIGQSIPNPELDEVLCRFNRLRKVVILTEATSNVKCPGTSSSIDRLITRLNRENTATLTPELLITMGDAIVSKRIRSLLRAMNPYHHWHIDPSDKYIDTFQSLTLNIPMRPTDFFNGLATEDIESDYSLQWSDLENITQRAHQSFLSDVPWSDLKVFDLIHRTLPKDSSLHLANSTPIRYIQLFDQREDIDYRSNRGVSGIDGCSSTAVGFAYVSSKRVTLVTGDIAFLYDVNAFFHHHLPSNLVVIVINNGGGNIFRYIPGPSTTRQLEEHFETAHSFFVEGIATTFGVSYQSVSDESGLCKALAEIYESELEESVILEVMTPREQNAVILKKYFDYLSQF